MKRIVLAGVALAALMGGSAMAADMGAPLYKAPPPAPPTFSWTGWYIGTNTGIAAGRTTTRNVAPYGGFDAGIPLSYDVSPVGIFGGGQLGYNWQLGSFLLGAEADVGYLGVRESQRPAPDDLVEVKYGWYGTLTARGGFVYDRLLTYVKGGAVVAGIRNTASDLDGAGIIDPSDFSQTNNTRWGWTVGSGFEYALLPNWTVKSEYLYMDFGTKSSGNLDGDVFQHHNRLQTFKIGLNYKWGGSLLPGGY